MTGNPSALKLEDALEVDEARHACRILAQRRRAAREELQKAEDRLADKQRMYRRAKAEAYIRRADMKPADAQKIAVEADAADAEYERDVAKGVVHLQEELLKEIDAERSSIHRLIDWSAQIQAEHEPRQFEDVTPRRVA